MKQPISLVKITFLYIFIFLFSQAVGALIVYLIYPARDPLFSLRANLFPYMHLIAVFVGGGILLLTTAWVTRFDPRRFFGNINPKVLLLTVVSAVVFNFILRFDKVFLSDTSLRLRPIEDILFTGRFLGPFVEEIFFRGFMLASFLKVTQKTGVSVVLSSLLFSLAHFNFVELRLYTLFIAFLLGLVTSVIMIKYRNLWYCIAFHLVYNLWVWITHS